MERTENNAVTHPTTLSPLLDLFAIGGALRNRSDEDIWRLFSKSFESNQLYTLKYLFYCRDIRGGLGERRVFRVILKRLLRLNDMARLLPLIPEYGRWDDIFEAIGTNCEVEMVSLVKQQLHKDIDTEYPSLLAKWMPSENTSSSNTRMIAKKLRTLLEMTSRNYRKMLSKLRARLQVIECFMCSKSWDKIDYEKVPSKAMLQYRKAFWRNDEERYGAFIESVEKGEKKIKSSTLYPYDIVRPMLRSRGRGNLDRTAIAQWEALPNYLDDSQVLIVCDVSGSMFSNDYENTVQPIEVSVSLAIYAAERLKHPAFKDRYITFSTTPELIKLKGENIQDKIKNIPWNNWRGSTNIQAVFNLVLETSQMYQVPVENMPTRIIIISDMEFNICGVNTNLHEIKRKYKEAGYPFPQLVFWNVNSKTTQYPSTIIDENTVLVSGASSSVFDTIVSGDSAMDTMLKVLESERYAQVC